MSGVSFDAKRSEQIGARPRRPSRRPSVRPLPGLVAVLLLAVLAAVACAVNDRLDGVPTAATDDGGRATPSRPHPPHLNANKGVGGTYEGPTHVGYSPRGDDDPRPNVLLITTDDQALTDLRWMPKTRHWLAEQGITFTHMLSPHPLCCPARAEIVTGQFAQNSGVHTNAGPYGGLGALEDPDNTLAWWLQKDHYQTAMVGKYLNGYRVATGVPRGWDHWNAATHNGFGYYDYVLYNDGRPRFYGHGKDSNNSSTVIAADTTRLIHDYAEDERPFFIWSSYFAPHGLCGDTGGCANPPEASAQYANSYPDAVPPSTAGPGYNEADVSDKPHVIRHQQLMDDGAVRYLFLQRIRALASVDDGIDQTMRALEETGELDNTLILFTSDNGYLLGEHRYLGKVLPYEEALEVPLLLRGPGLPQGVSRDQTATTVDLAPTILDAAGARAGRVEDGRSLLPFAADPTRQRLDDTILIQAGGSPDAQVPQPWMYRGVRTDRYTYVEWAGGFTELYDRDADPFQLDNIAGASAYARVQDELSARVAALKGCAGDTCRQVFGPLPQADVAQAAASSRRTRSSASAR
jgi:arylsulfatase A-like enzyme